MLSNPPFKEIDVITVQSLPNALTTQRAGAAFRFGIGATILSTLGFFWLGWGFGSVDAFPIGGWLALYLVSVVFVTVAVRALLRAKALATLSGARRGDFWAEHGRQFKLTSIFEGSGCGIVVLVTVHFHRPELVASGIALVVGLHFFPLARIFRFPLYYSVGAAVVVCAVLSALLFRGDAATAAAGIGTGVVLWVTALCALSLSRQHAEDLPMSI